MMKSCVSGLALTISYDQYHQDNHDPDHDPCQKAQEDDEEQADEHSDNQASAESTDSEWADASSHTNWIKVKKQDVVLQMSVSDLHQDPVPGLCVVLKDFHDHLTSFHNYSGVPVERFLCLSDVDTFRLSSHHSWRFFFASNWLIRLFLCSVNKLNQITSHRICTTFICGSRSARAGCMSLTNMIHQHKNIRSEL